MIIVKIELTRNTVSYMCSRALAQLENCSSASEWNPSAEMCRVTVAILETGQLLNTRRALDGPSI